MPDGSAPPPDGPTAPAGPSPTPRQRGRRGLLFLAVCGLGISAIVTQLVLMRELLCVLAGNEMTFGIILGNWFLLTGLGAALGRSAGRWKRPVAVLIVAQGLVALLPVGQVFALRALRNVVFLRGAEVGVVEGLVGCFVLLGPYCLIAGYLLTLACTLLARRTDAAGIGQVYFLDVLGDIVGGLLFTFVLVGLAGHFGVLYVPAAINLALALAVAVAERRKLLAVGIGVVAAGGIALAAAVDLDGLSTRLEYAGRRVVYRGSSPYGQLVVTESAGQYDFIENGVPLFSTRQVEQTEQTVHFALAQRPRARRVLLIGGGVSGTAREVLKYPVEAVEYVELDPLVVTVAPRFAPGSLADARIAVHTTDGRLFVRRTDRRYDVVIVDVPDPSTSQINRFYTAEFFGEVRRVLAPGGVLAVSVGHYENFLSDELARLIATAHRTLKEAFAHVLALPGGRVFLLASDGELTADVAGRVQRAGVRTKYVTRAFLDETLSPERIAAVGRALDADAPVNRDFSPVLYYYHLRYWLARHKVRFGLLAVAGGAALLIYFLRVRAVSLAVFTTGFAASAMQIAVLLGFQAVHGCLYHRVGLIVTMFMVGLAAGSYLANRHLARWGRRELVRLEWAVAACAVLLPAALPGLGRLAGAAEALSGWVAFPLLALAPAVLVGMEFPLAGKVDFGAVAPTASRLYTADYVGACAGALLVSTLLVPVLGVFGVCAVAAGLNVASGLILRLTR